MSQPSNVGQVSEELDSRRGKGLEWAMSADDISGKHSSSRINSNQPISVSLLRGIMNRIHQLTNVNFFDPTEDFEINGVKVHTGDPSLKFSPRHHYYIDEELISPMGNQIINNFLDSTKGVEGQRAKLVLDAVTNIGRPQQNIFGQLSAMMGKQNELETPEEIGTYD